MFEVDSRFLPASAGMTGNDGLKKIIGRCGLTSPVVNLTNMPFLAKKSRVVVQRMCIRMETSCDWQALS